MARHEHHEEAEEAEGGMERWLLTYADMITLLLALFIVLFALSTISVKKFEALAMSLKNTFSGHTTVVKNDTGLLQHNSLVDHPGSVQSSHPSPVTTPPNPFSTLPPTQSTAPTSSSSSASASTAGAQPLSTIQKELAAALASQGLSADVAMTQVPSSPTTNDLVVRILADKVFYAVDSADLGPVGDRVVDTIASVLKRNTNNAVVQGYTDNQAIYGGPYATNWELSAERAVHVVVRLARVDGLDPSRLAATGYGHTRPLVPNDTPAHMAENRRVDVVILAPGKTQP